MKDLGPIHHFLGIEITLTFDWLHLSQSHYALTILEKGGMVHCKHMRTPLEAKTKGLHNTAPLADPTPICNIVGALQYLILTRPDLAFSVNFVSQFIHAPNQSYLKMARCILHYVKGTITFRLDLTSHTKLNLYAFLDSDWAGCPYQDYALKCQ